MTSRIEAAAAFTYIDKFLKEVSSDYKLWVTYANYLDLPWYYKWDDNTDDLLEQEDISEVNYQRP